ncbi:uncharacterized protein LOC133890219 [Phragmites australis]|uniref:uncharacterized protein LOC133890219 n=1 Tax=Phragmites australis TaxID=29695 RepID=UPI002D770238|nr:uncharacterized protein LOC133890219 [Phragmites australis]
MPPGVADRAPPPQSPLRIKQNGKFYERLLSKESSAANLSIRYYWAEPGSVPFVWESQPGTPKDVARMAAGALPAITPPPSYLLRHGNDKAGASSRNDQQSKAGKSSMERHGLKRITMGFIAGIFRRLSLGKAWRRPEPPVKVSSPSRWLFSSVTTGERDEHNHDEEAAVAAHAQQHKTALFSFRARPSPWLLRFRGSGNRDGNDVWA